MTDRPDIGAALEEGERLLWKGGPKPGRPVPLRATVFSSIFFAATALLMILAWYLAIWWGHVPKWRLAVYGLIGTSAFLTYLGLRLTLLDLRRARARDRRTAYAITDRRALLRAGPYGADLALAPGVTVKQDDDNLTIAGETTRLRFERLDDAAAARDILLAQIEGSA